MQLSQKGDYLACLCCCDLWCAWLLLGWATKTSPSLQVFLPLKFTQFLSKFVYCLVSKNILAEKLIINGPKCSCTLRELHFKMKSLLAGNQFFTKLLSFAYRFKKNPHVIYFKRKVIFSKSFLDIFSENWLMKC